MPVDFKLDKAKCIVHSRGWGDVTDADLMNHMARIQELFEEGTLNSTWAQVYDFSTVKNIDNVTSNGIRSLAYDNPWPEESVRVIIAPKDVQFGLARMYQILIEQETNHLRITRSIDDALLWIADVRKALGGAT
jgi:hypothetical protein